jgi:hypothetical protein
MLASNTEVDEIMDGHIWLVLALIPVAVSFAMAGVGRKQSEPKKSKY